MEDYKNIDWPELSEIDHVKGRTATEEDINAGRAVFMLQSEDGKISGSPLDIEIPQYAIHVDDETGQETPGIVIQAEEAIQGPKAIGFVTIDSGEFQVGLLHEYKLLGSSKP